ncbi:MAG: NAD(P)/FAD-dependent oxidoreductase [Gammaproteobacteria bacterium]|nr:NAD(P)/FAD-dependent oxidoreductase [Gammaproteobacteria bacterium]
MNMNRRQVLAAIGAVSASTLIPSTTSAAVKPRVLVIGGGFAGSTAAKYIRKWSSANIDVKLIDPKTSHTSCVMSNLVLNRQLKLSDLKFSHGPLNLNYGVEVVKDRVVEIDPVGHRVRLRSGGWEQYDKLIIATGIAFKKPKGVNFNLTPHAWIAGGQTNKLATMVESLGAGSTFVMTIPKAPYRCPPGPYERACLVADHFKRNGFDSGESRVIVLDENPWIQAERHTFEKAFSGIYSNIIEYIPNAEIAAVRSELGVVETSLGDFAGDVVNPIPRHRAHGFVRKSGLTDSSGWAMVDPVTYESTAPDGQDVYIIGDAQNTKQPKSGHMANSQAKICADAILRDFTGGSNYTEERLANITTNSACYSPITYDEASWLTANFAYDQEAGGMALTHIGEAENWNRENFRQMFGWANNLFSDSFL